PKNARQRALANERQGGPPLRVSAHEPTTEETGIRTIGLEWPTPLGHLPAHGYAREAAWLRRSSRRGGRHQAGDRGVQRHEPTATEAAARATTSTSRNGCAPEFRMGRHASGKAVRAASALSRPSRQRASDFSPRPPTRPRETRR